MGEKIINNKLNDLNPKDWLKFQKSWFIHNPPARTEEVVRHPAKFPETMVQQFIEFFTKKGQVVFDPMVGTGSTLIAALRSGRPSYGIELNPDYVDIAKQRIYNERELMKIPDHELTSEVIAGNAMDITHIIVSHKIPLIDYMITSPPYWNMLHAQGASTQKNRRTSPNFDVIYSDDARDLGNINDYEEFLHTLVKIYNDLKPYLRHNAYLTIIVKNIKKKGKIYPFAWDLAHQLSQVYTLKDEKLWLQDNQKLAPYGLGNAWVSNTFHHYCLQFRNQEL